MKTLPPWLSIAAAVVAITVAAWNTLDGLRRRRSEERDRRRREIRDAWALLTSERAARLRDRGTQLAKSPAANLWDPVNWHIAEEQRDLLYQLLWLVDGAASLAGPCVKSPHPGSADWQRAKFHLEQVASYCLTDEVHVFALSDGVEAGDAWDQARRSLAAVGIGIDPAADQCDGARQPVSTEDQTAQTSTDETKRTMQKWWERDPARYLQRAAAVTAVFILAGFVLVAVLAWAHPGGRGDLATWATAVATAGTGLATALAVTVALWVSTIDARRRQDDLAARDADQVRRDADQVRREAEIDDAQNAQARSVTVTVTGVEMAHPEDEVNFNYVNITVANHSSEPLTEVYFSRVYVPTVRWSGSTSWVIDGQWCPADHPSEEAPPIGLRPTCDVLSPRGEATLRFAYGQLDKGEIIKPGEDLRGQVMFSDARGKLWIRDGFLPPEHYVPGRNEHAIPEPP